MKTKGRRIIVAFVVAAAERPKNIATSLANLEVVIS